MTAYLRRYNLIGGSEESHGETQPTEPVCGPIFNSDIQNSTSRLLIIRPDIRETRGEGADWIWMNQDSVNCEEFCHYGNEPFGSTTATGFLTPCWGAGGGGGVGSVANSLISETSTCL
jgi:hypothetical protein